MGQAVTVIEKKSSIPGVVRYETNRVLSGTGHEVYRGADDAYRDTWCDELARRLFAHGGIDTVSIHGNVITVKLTEAVRPHGVKQIIETMYIYYGPGVEVVIPEGTSAD